MGVYKEIKVVSRKISCLLEETRICRRVMGFRGILAVSANLLFGHPKHLLLQTDGLRHPLFLRLRTSDAKTYDEVILGGEYEYSTPSPPRTIVDVGANCGLTTVFNATRYPEARVIAVEPERTNYEALLRNTARYPNVTAVHAALWNADTEVEVFPAWPRFRSWGKWGFRVREGKGCRALTLPTLMREWDITSVDILKVDIEGAECEIFSACDWMDRVKLLAIELHDRDRSGCREAVDAAARTHKKFERGLVTFYLAADSANTS